MDTLWRCKSALTPNFNCYLSEHKISCLRQCRGCAKFQVIPIRGTHIHTYAETPCHIPPHTHNDSNDKFITASALRYHVVGADNISKEGKARRRRILAR